ncbi:type II toxin-antitoxin system death-on-curing family toxin [Salimicrobium flavidum]|uniref:Death on curing protein n=1 Tax=Salimicrobium flavidum TaxID=570947 RepID=A0A1N7KEW7_9BACI|nr:type II toxin-antitoxin system death-on-curing family toxin [Salimicrobium flavidum]SIS60040.1 death on curing protein [Salimicrobium flavidum]
MSFIYLKTKDVALIHFMIMKKYGDGEHAGIKDQDMLESAVHRPQQSAFGDEAYPRLVDKAAALFESLARNHCFHNGNKRTALASVDIFLKKNGCKLIPNDEDIEEFTVTVAQREVEFNEIVVWLEATTTEYRR